jgi:hemoglobin-like flavoprotein
MNDLVSHSLECAAARCDDLTPLVYARLFATNPDLEALFRKDARLVQGEMLARAIEGILDFIGDDAYARNLFASEATTHAGYDVAPHVFLAFFRAIGDAVRDVIGPEWTPAVAAAWERLYSELDACVAAQTA